MSCASENQWLLLRSQSPPGIFQVQWVGMSSKRRCAVASKLTLGLMAFDCLYIHIYIHICMYTYIYMYMISSSFGMVLHSLVPILCHCPCYFGATTWVARQEHRRKAAQEVERLKARYWKRRRDYWWGWKKGDLYVSDTPNLRWVCNVNETNMYTCMLIITLKLI